MNRRSGVHCDAPVRAIRARTAAQRCVAPICCLILAVLSVAASGCRSAPSTYKPLDSRPDAYLTAALRAADWLESHVERTENGATWEATPSSEAASSEAASSEAPSSEAASIEASDSTGGGDDGDTRLADSGLYDRGSTRPPGSTAAPEILHDQEFTSGARTVASLDSANLYHGSPGVVLFFLEAHAATANELYLELATAGADALIAVLPEQDLEGEQAGLYTGIAGIGYVLEEVYRATGSIAYRQAANQCVDLLYYHSREVGSGVEWSDSTDVISGSAGIGFFLLFAHEHMQHPDALALAIKAGNRLLEVAQEAEGGSRWLMNPQFPRYMPNFSHGTAGVASFLAALYEDTQDRRYLHAAEQGAKHLVSIADVREGEARIPHHTPGGDNLFYLGWCHGPVGTARLFYQLYRITENPLWLDWIERSASAILNSGIPEITTPGFWNNDGQCCGSAGVLEFYLDLERATGNDMYLDAARHVGDHLLARSSEQPRGVFWVQAEHRRRPEQVAAQTGYMQGAAGIGIALLHLSNRLGEENGAIYLPDSPYRR